MFNLRVVPIIYVFGITIWATCVAMGNALFVLVVDKGLDAFLSWRLISIEMSWIAFMYVVLSSRFDLKVTVPLSTLLVIVETAIAMTA